jgi:predicted metalloprotease
MLSAELNPGHETIEERLLTEAEITWDDIAFHTVKHTLERYFSDRRKGSFGIHTIDIT